MKLAIEHFATWARHQGPEPSAAGHRALEAVEHRPGKVLFPDKHLPLRRRLCRLCLLDPAIEDCPDHIDADVALPLTKDGRLPVCDDLLVRHSNRVNHRDQVIIQLLVSGRPLLLERPRIPREWIYDEW
jgi:hypothetical protein